MRENGERRVLQGYGFQPCRNSLKVMSARLESRAPFKT
jgi:hypothetical protein